MVVAAIGGSAWGGGGAVMIAEQTGQGPSTPAAASGTDRWMPQDGQSNLKVSDMAELWHGVQILSMVRRVTSHRRTPSTQRMRPENGGVASMAT